jgi:hypothetical protein
MVQVLLLGSVIGQSVNWDDKHSVQVAAKQMASGLLEYYKKSHDGQGVVTPSSAKDSSGVQWYESGLYWGAFMEYARVFGDNSFAGEASTALNLASFGKVASFLGPNAMLAASLQGKWNDDIMWFGLAGIIVN